MRRNLFRLGWILLFTLPVIYAIEIYITQDLPRIEAWKWMIGVAAGLLIFFSRNTDEVIRHHVV